MSETINTVQTPEITIDEVQNDTENTEQSEENQTFSDDTINIGIQSQEDAITVPVSTLTVPPPPKVTARRGNGLEKSGDGESKTSSATGATFVPPGTPHSFTGATLGPPGTPSNQRVRHTSREEELNHLSEEASANDFYRYDNLILAQSLIKDAESGRNFTYKTEPNYVRLYILYHRWYLRWGLYICIALNMCLALVEKPTRDGWEIPYWGSMIIELVLIVFFILRVIHTAYFSNPAIFWRDTKNIMVIGIITLTILDIICYIAWVNAAPDSHPVRWSRPLRSLLIINFSDGKQIRRAFRNIRRTIPEIMNVLILFMMSVFLFALLGLKLFGRRKSLTYSDGSEYFKMYFDSIWDLYVLVTTANYPDVMMPAYDESKWFALYFMTYLIICLYVFMSIVLAAIYNNYRQNLKNEIREAVFGKRRKLRQAFSILKVERNGHDVITRHIWNAIMTRVLPNKSIQQIELLMTILDKDSKGYIVKADFLNLVNLLQVPVSEIHDRRTFLEKRIPDIYNSRPSKVLRMFVRHKFFRYFFDFMIFINAWFIGFAFDDADWFFLGFFMLEIVLKMYTYGPKDFFKRLWNFFDFFVIFGAAVATGYESAAGDVGEELSTLDLLLVLYYMFAIVGMEIFHGQIKFYGYNESSPEQQFCGNPKLNESVFYRNHYCNNNFNDIIRSIVLLFELTVLLLSSGFVIVTNKWARLYFFTFHLFCVIIVLNIFVAFILEAFILEYSLQKTGKMDSVVETKIKELGLGIGHTRTVKTNDETCYFIIFNLVFEIDAQISAIHYRKGKGEKMGPPDVDKLELVSNEIEVDRKPLGSSNSSSASVNMGADGSSEHDSDTDSIPDLSNEIGVKFHLKKKSRKKVEVLLMQMFEGEINPEDDGDEETYNLRQRTLTLDAVT
ncbi:TPC1-like protein [Mya arenaria]|uniref:TPC1-like protein n=1 Tax=Mya arenaria TaxID=6604 RepID=A0ABY7F9V9_MYAAR|nr:TPC1-like protein [Mya arenaria]